MSARRGGTSSGRVVRTAETDMGGYRTRREAGRKVKESAEKKD